MPTARGGIADEADTVYPDGPEKTTRRFAIERRNRKMIDWSEIVVTYVCRPFGGAAKCRTLAERKGKEVIELSKQIRQDG